VLVCFRVGVLVFCLFVFVRCFGSFVFLVSALRVFRAVTRLTVYRAPNIFELNDIFRQMTHRNVDSEKLIFNPGIQFDLQIQHKLHENIIFEKVTKFGTIVHLIKHQ